MRSARKRQGNQTGVDIQFSSSSSFPTSKYSQLASDDNGYASEDSDGVEEDNSNGENPKWLAHEQRREGLAKNAIADQIAGMSDATVLGIIFSLFLTKATELFLHVTGKFIFFSLAALANIALSATAWNQARLDGWKRGSVVKAVMQTLFTIPITIAVAGSLLPFVGAAFPLFPTVIAPIMFSATLSIKFLYQAGAAVYYWGKSTGVHWGNSNSDLPDLEEPEFKKIKYQQMSKFNAIFAVSTAFAVGAIMTVFLYLKTEYAPLGIIAAGIGFGANGWLLGRNFFGSAEDVIVGQQTVIVHDQHQHQHQHLGHDHDLRHEHQHEHQHDDDLTPTLNGDEEDDDNQLTINSTDALQQQQNDSLLSTPPSSTKGKSTFTTLQLMSASSNGSPSTTATVQQSTNGNPSTQVPIPPRIPFVATGAGFVPGKGRATTTNLPFNRFSLPAATTPPVGGTSQDDDQLKLQGKNTTSTVTRRKRQG